MTTIPEIPASMYNTTTEKIEDTWMLIFGKIKGKRRTMTLTASLLSLCGSHTLWISSIQLQGRILKSMVGRQHYVITHKIQQERHDICRKCEINVIAGNVQKMKWNLKGSVKMKMQGGEMVNLIKFLYIPQAVKNLLIASRLVSKGDMSRGTQ